jgi:hypothetical protein
VFSVGPFCDWLNEQMQIPVFIPTGHPRKEFPHITVVSIVSNHPKTHQVGRHQIDDETTEISFPDRTQFSLTVVDDSANGVAETKCNELRNLLYSQVRKDWFAEQGLVFRMISFPKPRFLTHDDFSEERVGFDIEIGEVVKIVDEVAAVDEVTITDTGGKIDEIIVESGS